MKNKYRKLKATTKWFLKELFNQNEDTKDLIEYINTHFKKNCEDNNDFRELNNIIILRLKNKREQIDLAYKYHSRMLVLASLKGQRLALRCILKLTKEYQELYQVYRKFIKKFPVLRCTLSELCQIDKQNYDHQSYIEQANEFFQSVLK